MELISGDAIFQEIERKFPNRIQLHSRCDAVGTAFRFFLHLVKKRDHLPKPALLAGVSGKHACVHVHRHACTQTHMHTYTSIHANTGMYTRIELRNSLHLVRNSHLWANTFYHDLLKRDLNFCSSLPPDDP